MNENMHSYKSNLIIKSIYEISQKLGNIYPIPKKNKINKSLKEIIIKNNECNISNDLWNL